MNPPEPQMEHKWLQQLVGEWEYENEATMGPDQPPMKFCGKETVRSVGGIWVVSEGQGEMPGGGTATMILTLGYDPAKKRFVGTFLGSMMTYLWVYEGELDTANNVLTLNAEGPNFAGEGKMAKYRDVITLVNENHRILTSSVLTDEGKWQSFMTANYRRVG